MKSQHLVDCCLAVNLIALVPIFLIRSCQPLPSSPLFFLFQEISALSPLGIRQKLDARFPLTIKNWTHVSPYDRTHLFPGQVSTNE